MLVLVLRVALMVAAGVAVLESFRAKDRERRVELLLLAVLAVVLAR